MCDRPPAQNYFNDHMCDKPTITLAHCATAATPNRCDVCDFGYFLVTRRIRARFPKSNFRVGECRLGTGDCRNCPHCSGYNRCAVLPNELNTVYRKGGPVREKLCEWSYKRKDKFTGKYPRYGATLSKKCFLCRPNAMKVNSRCTKLTADEGLLFGCDLLIFDHEIGRHICDRCRWDYKAWPYNPADMNTSRFART